MKSSMWAGMTFLLASLLHPVVVEARHHFYSEYDDPNEAAKHMQEVYLRSLKEVAQTDWEAYHMLLIYLKEFDIQEPVAKPVDPRMPNMTLMVTRFGYDDCSYYQKGFAEIIQATAVPVCFEFLDHEPFGSVTINAKLSNMAWDSSGGPLRNARCSIVMYKDKTCHGIERMQAYKFMHDAPEGYCYRAWPVDTTRTKHGIVRAFAIECPGLIDPATITGRKYKERLQADGDWVEPAPPKHDFGLSYLDPKNVGGEGADPADSDN